MFEDVIIVPVVEEQDSNSPGDSNGSIVTFSPVY